MAVEVWIVGGVMRGSFWMARLRASMEPEGPWCILHVRPYWFSYVSISVFVSRSKTVCICIRYANEGGIIDPTMRMWDNGCVVWRQPLYARVVKRWKLKQFDQTWLLIQSDRVTKSFPWIAMLSNPGVEFEWCVRVDRMRVAESTLKFEGGGEESNCRVNYSSLWMGMAFFLASVETNDHNEKPKVHALAACGVDGACPEQPWASHASRAGEGAYTAN